MNIPSTFLPLLNHLHRGGTYGYWWTRTGDTKRSHWWPVGTPSDLPTGRDNIYFGVHATTAIPPTNTEGKAVKPAYVRSQCAYIAAINCVFGEYDAKDFSNSKPAALAHIDALPRPPTVIIDSGGGYHCYWLLRETFMLTTAADRQRAKRIQAAWVTLVGSDDDAKDLVRVLRVPGTRNYKDDYAPNFPPVAFVRADYDRLYDLDTLEALLPPAPVTPGRTKRATPPTDTTPDAPAPTVALSTIATTAQQLGRLDSARQDQYNDWLQVGMALRELGTIGLELWDTWSQSSGKYEPGACAAKWNTLRVDTTGITLASLERWIKEDTPPTAPVDDVDDIANLDEDTLRRRIREAEADRDRERQRADRLDDWRAWCIAVVAKPSKELSPAQKIVALGLHIDMERRVQAGITEPTPILISTMVHADGTTTTGIADRAGMSHDTVSKALPKLAEAGALAYEKKYDTNGHLRVYIAPAGYFDPATWAAPETRNHGGRRTHFCPECGSDNLALQQTRVCRDCSHRVALKETNVNLPWSLDQEGMWRETEPTTTTQDACWPSTRPKQQTLLDDIDLLPLADLLPDGADEPTQPDVLPNGRTAEPTQTANTQDAFIGRPVVTLHTQVACWPTTAPPTTTTQPTVPAVAPPPRPPLRLANSFLLQRHARERNQHATND